MWENLCCSFWDEGYGELYGKYGFVGVNLNLGFFKYVFVFGNF